MEVSVKMSSYYLELLEEPLNFPPVSKEINVFFDECNRQVFAVSAEGTLPNKIYHLSSLFIDTCFISESISILKIFFISYVI